MPDVLEYPLTRIDGVELARVGSWGTLMGRWDAKAADFTAAVESAACPATRAPIVKLGHLDQRFTPAASMPTFDGTPSIGWVENLRTDGDVLYGDLVGVPQWLRTVAASAFPNRSIEAAYNRRCAAGHQHPFSVGAVALLGVTPPGVDSLRSLNDIPALFGIAAAGCADLDAGEVIVATIGEAVAAADGDVHTGAMVALLPTAEDAARLAVDGGVPAEQLHCTLMYLGDAAEIPAKVRARLVDAVSRAVNSYPPVEADAFALSLFNPRGDEPCVVLGMSGEMTDDAHTLVEGAVRDVVAATALDLPEQHKPFVPHVTLAYTGDPGRLAALVDRTGPIVFDRVRVVFGGDATDIPLTAVGWDDSDWNTQWDAPAVAAADGKDSRADRNELKRYWTKDPRGLAKWAKNAHPWRSLYRHLKRFMKDEMARRVTSQWYHDVLGKWPGQKDGTKVAASDLPPQTIPDLLAPPPTEPEPTPPDEGGVSVPPPTPGAEPEHQSEPIEREGPVSTLSTDVRSRLGLTDDADDAAILAAVDALKVKADTPPVPDPQLVAASAAATKENDDLRKEVGVLASQVSTVTAELAATKAEKAATAKTTVLDEAVKAGKIAPATREQWERDYDEAPGAVTRVLASIHPGTAVPVAASGHTGTGEERFDDDEYEKFAAALDGPYAKKEA